MNRDNKDKDENKQNEANRILEEHIDKETEKSVLVSSKRNLSMEDPDYVRPPDAKRIRQLEEKAQDELCSRVIRVVDTELTQAMNEKESEIEEIDNRILRLQQCLHTLRYCVSLNFYAAPKVTGNIGSKEVHIHPCVRKKIGKAPVRRSSVPSKNNYSQILSTGQNIDNLVSFPSTSSEEQNSSDLLGISDILNETRTTNDSVFSNSPEKSKNNILSETLKNTEENKSKIETLSCPPSPKYLPPKAPESSQKIVQGRHQRFQEKKRVVVGNTYQYIGGVATGEVSDQLRYKWQMYVRGPTKEDDVSSFVSSVKFILDQSYAPHDVITIKKSPFVLSRRGWGEFKVQIVLEFLNKRNKSVRLLHPLVLSRPDDQLALTGLWRLGQENWYDVWVYDVPSDGGNFESSLTSVVIKSEDDEEKPSDLQKELKIGSVISKMDENITVVHNTEIRKEIVIKSEPIDYDIKNEIGTSEESSKTKHGIKSEISNITSKLKSNSESFKVIENKNTQNINLTNTLNNPGNVSTNVNASNILDDENKVDISSKTQASVVKESNGAGGKVCKIHVRQPDGRLLPCYIPAHMYSLALKIAQGGKQATPASKDNKTEQVSLKDGESSSSNSTPSCSPTKLVVTDDKKSNSVKETSKPISIEPSTSSSPPSLNDSRLTLTTQGGQTVARLASTSLSASMVQQLLNKASGKNKTCGVVQNVGSVSGLQVGQGRIINNSIRPSLKTNIQFVPLKLLQDKQTSVISKSSVPVSAANVKLITSNGQLIKSSNQVTKNVAIAAAPVATTTTTTLTSTSTVTTTTAIGKVVPSISSSSKCGIQNMVLMPGGQLVSGQVVSGSQIVSGGAQVMAGGQMVAASGNQIINSRRLLSGGQQVNQLVSGAAQIVTGNTKGLQIVTTQAGQILTTGKTGFQLIKGHGGNQLVASGGKGLQLITSQGGQFVSSGGKSLQLVTSRGCKLVSAGEKGSKGTTVVHLSPLVVQQQQQGDKGNLPKPILPAMSNRIVSSVGAIQVNKPQVAGVSLLRGSSVQLSSLLKPLSVISTSSGIKAASTVASGKNMKPIKPSENNIEFGVKNKIANIRNKQLDVKCQDLEDSIEQWELQCRKYERICGHCTSVSGCLRVWVRAFPIIAEANVTPPQSVYPHCAANIKQFLEWPIGKQRANEYGRAREILKRIKSLNRDDSNFWTLGRIIGWTRKQAYTPVKMRAYLSTDECPGEDDNSLTDELFDLENCPALTINDSFCDDVDVVAMETEVKNSPRIKIESPVKSKSMEFLSWEDEQLEGGCDWVSQCASELRISLPRQQVDSDYTADISKALLWKSALCFMEDLIRSSHCASWDAAADLTDNDESCDSVVPPRDIELTHVKSALYNSRPEFQLFSMNSLEINSDTIRQIKNE